MRPFLALFLSVLLPCSTALAWSRAGHMVSAAIAYDELSVQERRIVERIVSLAEKHPDRGAFEVAIDAAKGDERARRIFMELARWPDDARGSIHDHPTWHYWSRPIVDAASPPAKLPEDVPQGSAYEAFALSLSVAADTRASAGERASRSAGYFIWSATCISRCTVSRKSRNVSPTATAAAVCSS